MIALIQRVSEASVSVAGIEIARTGRGLLMYLGIERGDAKVGVERLVDRVLHYRVFEDERQRMSRSLCDIDGALLLVPQFTLAADTGRGLRPDFSPAAAPECAHTLFAFAMELAQCRHRDVQFGRFGADMQVHSINEGPATFWLRVIPGQAGDPGG